MLAYDHFSIVPQPPRIRCDAQLLQLGIFFCMSGPGIGPIRVHSGHSQRKRPADRIQAGLPHARHRAHDNGFPAWATGVHRTTVPHLCELESRDRERGQCPASAEVAEALLTPCSVRPQVRRRRPSVRRRTWYRLPSIRPPTWPRNPWRAPLGHRLRGRSSNALWPPPHSR